MYNYAIYISSNVYDFPLILIYICKDQAGLKIQWILDFSVYPLLHFCLFNQFIQINESFLSPVEL